MGSALVFASVDWGVEDKGVAPTLTGVKKTFIGPDMVASKPWTMWKPNSQMKTIDTEMAER